jgi:Zn-dependent M16 (insulinase) family peptidase
MAEREAANTGALDFSAGMATHMDGPEKAMVRISGWLKALDSEWSKAQSVFGDRLFRPDFADLERLRDIILQSRVAWRNQIVPSGNAYASLYAARNLNPALGMAERLQGCTQARYIDRIAADMNASGLGGLSEKLAALHRKALAAATPSAAMLGADSTYALVREWFAGCAEICGGAGRRQAFFGPLAGSDRVGLAAPADIAYAACAMPAPSLADPSAPALVLLGTQLSYGYLWNEVRVKGGAYGVRASLDGGRGSFNFSSYRDPNIERTLGIYLGTQGFVDNAMDLSAHGVEQAIIGAFKQLDMPIRPSSAVSIAQSRLVSGETEAFLREFRGRLLGLDANAIKKAADKVFSAMGGAPVCVLSSREKLTEENGKMERPLAIEPLWERA